VPGGHHIGDPVGALPKGGDLGESAHAGDLNLDVPPPPDKDKGTESATTSFKRIMRWFDKAGVRIIEPDKLADPQLALIGESRRTR